MQVHAHLLGHGSDAALDDVHRHAFARIQLGHHLQQRLQRARDVRLAVGVVGSRWWGTNALLRASVSPPLPFNIGFWFPLLN